MFRGGIRRGCPSWRESLSTMTRNPVHHGESPYPPSARITVHHEGESVSTMSENMHIRVPFKVFWRGENLRHSHRKTSHQYVIHCKNLKTSVRKFSNSLKNGFRVLFEKAEFMDAFLLGMKYALSRAIVILVTLFESLNWF